MTTPELAEAATGLTPIRNRVPTDRALGRRLSLSNRAAKGAATTRNRA